MDIPELPLTDPNAKPIKIKLEGAETFNEDLEKYLQALDDKIHDNS